MRTSTSMVPAKVPACGSTLAMHTFKKHKLYKLYSTVIMYTVISQPKIQKMFKKISVSFLIYMYTVYVLPCSYSYEKTAQNK